MAPASILVKMLAAIASERSFSIKQVRLSHTVANIAYLSIKICSMLWILWLMNVEGIEHSIHVLEKFILLLVLTFNELKRNYDSYS